jgi:predicted phosphoribosyltransferase
MLYQDRRDGGRELAERLAGRTDDLGVDPIVLALPRGGVPVGFEVAKRLGVPLDVFVVRKVGVPGHEELAMGAIASGGVVVLNRDVIDSLQIPEALVKRTIEERRRELERREAIYRVRPPPRLLGRSVILVDDGLATGSTMQAAVAAVRLQQPERVIVAVPLSSYQACQEVGEKVELILCGETPEPFYGVGAWYEDFSQTSDEEVRALLRAAHESGEEVQP